MAFYYIYKLTNTVNGKGYIGFTSKSPEKRWDLHREKARKKVNFYLYDAINKYGWETFKKEVLYCSKDGQHTLNEMESLFIREHNTFYMNEQGYNMTLGGGGMLGHKASKESIQRRSKRMQGSGNTFYGRHHTEEHKRRVSEGVKRTRYLRIGDKAPHAGHKHSDVTRKQIGDTQAGTWEITFPDGHVATILNLRAFCREHNLTAPLMIAVSKNLQKQHKKFRCRKLNTSEDKSCQIQPIQ
jgi:group I intron endonuclease